ncbi:MAG: hypothetical protein R2728_06600 [Chitinophagales bacterium]
MISKGTLIQDIPVGCHWLTIVNLEYPACTDSIYVCVECPQIVTDTIIVNIPEGDTSIVCVDGVYDLDDVVSASVCDA